MFSAAPVVVSGSVSGCQRNDGGGSCDFELASFVLRFVANDLLHRLHEFPVSARCHRESDALALFRVSDYLRGSNG